MADGNNNVDSFCSITGVSKNIANKYLKTCNNDLSIAVQSYYDNPSLFLDEKEPSSSSDHVRAPIAPVRQVLVEPSINRNRPRKRRQLPGSIFDQSPFHSVTRSDTQRHSGVNSAGTSLADLFRPPVDIMFPGTFKEARTEASKQRKWLLVNIQDVKEFPCQILNRDVWNNPMVKDLIKNHFLFWQVSSMTDDGIDFNQFYNISEYPYVAIIDPRTGEKLVHWTHITVEVFRVAINCFLSNNSFDEDNIEPLAKRRREVNNNVISLLDESEDTQLAAAVAASLEEQTGVSSRSSSTGRVDLTSCTEGHTHPCDRHTSSSKGHAFSTKEHTLSTEGHTFSTTGHTSSTTGHTSFTKGHTSSNEGHPCSSTGHTSYGASSCGQYSVVCSERTEVVALVMRLPNGERVEKQFPADNPIQDLISFLATMGYDCNQRDYEVVTNFPNRTISSLNLTSTFREAGLHPRSTLFIQAI